MNSRKNKYWEQRLKDAQSKKETDADQKPVASESIEKLNDKYSAKKEQADNKTNEQALTSNEQIKVDFEEMNDNDEDLPASLGKKTVIKRDGKQFGYEG